MPTYEYECQKCKNIFEKFQSMTDEPLKTCPKCKGKVQRLIGAGAGLIFKGSGFYITDYRKDDYKCKSKSETKPVSVAKPDSCPSKATCPDKKCAAKKSNE